MVADNSTLENAKNIFQFLSEIKNLSSPSIKDYEKYDQIIWIDDIPREKGCYTKAWELVDPSIDIKKDNWVEIEKPVLSNPPTLPDILSHFMNEKEWRDATCSSPSLLNVSNEYLIRYFFSNTNEIQETNENNNIFETYIKYVDKQWQPWANKQLNSESDEHIKYPEPPATLHPYLKEEHLNNHIQEELPLTELSTEIDAKLKSIRSTLEIELQHYLDKKWQPWATQEKKQLHIQQVYNQLYSIYQRHKKLGEQYELIIGFGLLVWNAPKSKRIRRHILTTKSIIDFDTKRGMITIRPPSNGAPLIVEDDMLDAEERPQPTEKSNIDKLAKHTDNNLWNKDVLSDLSKSFINAIQYNEGQGLKNDGQFNLSLEKPQQASSRPQINLAPAIILRKRSQKGFIRLLDKIKTNIDQTSSIPEGIRAIISSSTTQNEKHVEGKNKQAFSSQEIYFPLPANKEQMKIVEYLNYGRGVRVQGPPGTGKSHTITNLICHLLATGQRILVTSQTERALHSLRSKFTSAAEPLSALAVILLGNDSTSLHELEKSVQAINAKKAYWNKNNFEEAISHYEKQLSDIRKQRRLAENDLKSLRESDTYKYKNKFDRYNGTLQEIAQQIASEKTSFAWFKDKADKSLDIEDIIDIDAEILVKKWHQWSLRELINNKPSINDIEQLPNTEIFSKIVQIYINKQQDIKLLENKTDNELYQSIKNTNIENTKELLQAINPILSGLQELKQHIEQWSFQAGQQIVAGQEGVWQETYHRTQEKIEKIEPLIKKNSSIEVSGIQDNNIRRIKVFVHTAMQYAKAGKKVKRSIFHPKEYKEALKNIEKIQIDGHSINSLEQLELINTWLSIKDSLNTIHKQWQAHTTQPNGRFSTQLAFYKNLLKPLQLALSLHNKVQIAHKLVTKIPNAPIPIWHNVKALSRFKDTFEFLLHTKTLEKIDHTLQEYANKVISLGDKDDLLLKRLKKAIIAHDMESYQTLRQQIKQRNKLHNNQNNLLLDVKNFQSKLPNTFEKFKNSNNRDKWIARINSLPKIIQWTHASNWIDQMCDSKASQKLNSSIEELTNKERELLGLIAEEKAWFYCISRLGENQRQALVAWLQAIEKIGKGTGRHAEHHRRIARKKLNDCQSAIPAWVMPLHRVVETIDAKPNVFDVVIIDEASQSGSDAIILNYLAKKVIVVGDDKQIRPQSVGINHDDVEALRKRHLNDIPHSETFDLKSSYFSQAEIRFPNQVSLREHFRCMPEIIQFSNKHFYHSAPLIPLKQFGSNRLKPIITKYIENGYRTGQSSKAYNEPEAIKLVEHVVECCSDPKYDSKTFGIITLLGHEQAKLIEEILLKKVDPQEYEKRKIMIGSAYTFQGDERDIIFISMVNAPQEGRTCRSVTSMIKEREFNVASSRAIEQMILFHSVLLNDLKENCLQYKLLEHCLNPSIQAIPSMIDISKLQEKSHYQERNRGNQPSPFDSWFEVDVFLEIANKGYHVIPQYVVNPSEKTYRIDMVIMGLQANLAIECDGDHWHGIAQYEADMVRQRELERCGWEFWRVRGGAYYRDPTKAMNSLWSLLNKKDIHPREKASSNIVPLKPTTSTKPVKIAELST